MVNPALICGDRVPYRFSKSVDERVVNDVLPRIPTDRWQDLNRPLPLQFETSLNAVVLEALPHCTGSFRQFAVYALECRHTHRWRQHAATEVGKLKSDRWTGDINRARRIIYVGVTVNLQRRLVEHVDATDSDGAEFTQVFPPLRVLDVSWYRNYRRAQRAEKRLADAVSERFPDDYVYQS